MKGIIRERVGIVPFLSSESAPSPKVNLVESLERSPHPDADKFEMKDHQSETADPWKDPYRKKPGRQKKNESEFEESKPKPEPKRKPAEISEDGLIGDLLWVYAHWGGKEELLATIKNDRDLQRAFVRELLAMQKRDILDSMKAIETLKKSNRGPGAKKFTFVVKGLYDRDVALSGKTKEAEPEPGLEEEDVFLRAENGQNQTIDAETIEDADLDAIVEI